MIRNVNTPPPARHTTVTELLFHAGRPVATIGALTLVSVRPVAQARRTSWGEVVHLRHHPSRQLTVYADSEEEALRVLAEEFHDWEVRESLRFQFTREYAAR